MVLQTRHPSSRTLATLALCALLSFTGIRAQTGTEPTSDDVVRRMGAYVAAYGEEAPSKMSETYEGALPVGTGQPILGRAMTVATYSEFKRFETSAKISVPK